MIRSQAIPPYHRAYDALGGKLHVTTQCSERAFSQGDIIHFHIFTFSIRANGTLNLSSNKRSVTRRACPNVRRHAIELCGGTGSILDALALVGYNPLASIELNQVAMSYSSPRHPVIIGDARDFSLYSLLPDVDILGLGFPCQPFATHGTRKGETVEKGQLAALGPLVANFLGCPSFILESVPGFAAPIASHNPLGNPRLISQACGFHISTGESLLRQTWIHTETGSSLPDPPCQSPPPLSKVQPYR